MPKVDEDEATDTKPKKSGKKPAKTGPRRPAQKVYPEVREQVMRGDDAMSIEQAKEYLGWEQVEAFDDSCSPAIKTVQGLNVRLNQCHKQRWLDDAKWLRMLRQEWLNKKFRYNGKTVILGDHGAVLDGQYRMTSMVCAEHERTNGPEAKQWQRLNPKPLTMETIVVYGLDEDDDMFATFNAVLAGTGADTIFRSDIFADSQPPERKHLSRIAEYAVRTVWDRTGHRMNAWTPDLNVTEIIEFLRMHPFLKHCCQQIWTEDGKGASVDDGGRAISNWLSRGYAAGLCYLFAANATDGQKYLASDTRGEKLLDMSLQDKAFEFWVYMGSMAQDAKPLRDALNDLILPGDNNANWEQVAAVLCNAWNFFKDDKEFTRKDVFPRFVELEKDEEGNVVGRKMEGNYCVGGIDLGPRPEKEEEEPDEQDAADGGEEDGGSKPIKERKPAAEPAKPSGGTAKDSIAKQLANNRLKYKGDLILYKTSTGVYSAWEDDADTVVRLLGVKMNRHPTGLDRCFFPATELAKSLKRLRDLGNRVTILDNTKDDAHIATYEASGDEAPAAPTKDDDKKAPAKPAAKPKKQGLKGGIG